MSFSHFISLWLYSVQSYDTRLFSVSCSTSGTYDNRRTWDSREPNVDWGDHCKYIILIRKHRLTDCHTISKKENSVRNIHEPHKLSQNRFMQKNLIRSNASHLLYNKKNSKIKSFSLYVSSTTLLFFLTSPFKRPSSLEGHCLYVLPKGTVFRLLLYLT